MEKFFKVIRSILMLLILSFSFVSNKSEASNAIPVDNLRYPVLLTLEKARTGSGFYINDKDKIVYFVTARHMLFRMNDATKEYELKSNTATLLSYSYDISIDDPIEIKLNLDILYKDNNIRIHKLYDVVVIKILEAIKEGRQKKTVNGVVLVKGGKITTVARKNIKKFDEVLVGNNIFIFGYPTSLVTKNIQQIEDKKPLVRKGIIAGLNKKNNTIILDCTINFGNSGGPVIEVEQINITSFNFRLIGLITEIVPFVEEWTNKRYNITNVQIENSGYSIAMSMDSVLKIIDNW